MKRLTRKELPPYAKIQKTVDLNRLIQYCVDNGYTNYETFNDIKYSADSSHKPFLVANTYCKDAFFKEEDAESLEGEKYKQLYLTDIDPSKLINNEDKLDDTHSSIFIRSRRLDPSSKDYIPEADEHNYTVKNEHVKGIFDEILNMFSSPVNRVRLAVIMPGFTIKPHVDYDPSYVTRYHIPIITNDGVVFGSKTKEGDINYTMPADGSIYFFNSGMLHWVSNNGTEPRLHLIVDTNGQSDLEF
jgi:hypothetical protein